MFLRVLRGSLRRELSHLAADPWDRGLLLWLPLLSLVVVAGIFFTGQIRDLPIGVIDGDRSTLSRQLVRMVDAAPGVRVADAPIDHATGVRAMQSRDLYGVVEIPAGFERDIKRGMTGDVLFLYNAQFATAAGIVARDVQSAVLTFAAGVRLVSREKHGEAPVAAQASVQAISLRLVSLYNETIDYRVFLGAALIPSILQIFIMVVGTSVVGREIRDRSMGDWLASAEGRMMPALLGKLIPAQVIFSIWGFAFLVIWGIWHGSVSWSAHSLLMIGMLVMVAAYLLLGALLAALLANLRMALSLVGFYTAPAFAYVGQAFPLMAMPMVGQVWAKVLPLTWWLQLQNQQWLMDAPIEVSLRPLSILFLMALIGGVGGGLALRRVAARPERWGAR